MSINTDFRVRKSKWGCFVSSLIIAITWCYIVGMIAENLTKLELVLVYSVGYAYGDVLGLHFNKYIEKIINLYGRRFKRKHKRVMKRKK